MRSFIALCGSSQVRESVATGALIVVGGHSRGVGKTALIEHILRATGDERWAVIKISAHRHAPPGASVPVIEEARDPTARTQTGRYLAAGATRAFLIRAPDAALAQATVFIDSLRQCGWHVIVESNRIVRLLTPDVLIFVVDPSIDDWKPSAAPCVAAAHLVVSGPPWDRAALRLIRGACTSTAQSSAATAMTAGMASAADGGDPGQDA